MINVAIMGYGTVGAGVFKVLTMNHDLIAKRVGEELNVKYVLDLREFPGDPAQEVLTCVSSSPTFLMMYSAYKLNRQGDNIQP